MTQEQTSEAVTLVTLWVNVGRLDTGGTELSVGSCEAEVAAIARVWVGAAACGCWGRAVASVGI